MGYACPVSPSSPELQRQPYHNTRSSEYDERKKGWKRCERPIFLSGTQRGTSKRHNTGKREWLDAQPIAAAIETCGNWSGKIPVSPQPSLAPTTPQARPITIADAVKAYLANREGAKISPDTLRKYRTFTKELSTFAESRGYVLVEQITAGDVDVLRHLDLTHPDRDRPSHPILYSDLCN
jgi:hypothetical protein